MAVPIEQKNLLNYLTAFQGRVARRTNINLFDRDSKTQALIDVFSDQLLADRRDMITAIDSLQVSQAQGAALEKLGQSKGVFKLSETFASVTRDELNTAFYVASGTFGDLNGGVSFTVPKGTKVFSAAAQNDLSKVITYSLTEDVVCVNTESLAYFSAKSDASGSEFNVGASTLRKHNFSTYSSGTGLLTINFYSILNGRNRETQEQYRYRIAQLYTSIASSNQLRAQMVSLTVPGVQDTRVVEGHFGIGTVGLIVLGAEFQSNPTLISAVQQAVDIIALPGVKVHAVAAVNALVDIEVTVKTSRTLTSAEQVRLQSNLKRLSVGYFRSRGLGATISLNELARLWARNTGGVLQFATSAVDIFDHVYVRRGYVSSVVSERETLNKDYYTLQADEFADLGTLSITFE